MKYHVMKGAVSAYKLSENREISQQFGRVDK